MLLLIDAGNTRVKWAMLNAATYQLHVAPGAVQGHQGFMAGEGGELVRRGHEWQPGQCRQLGGNRLAKAMRRIEPGTDGRAAESAKQLHASGRCRPATGQGRRTS